MRVQLKKEVGKKQREKPQAIQIIRRKIGFVLDACATETAIVVCGALLSIIEAQLEQIKLRLLAA